MKTKAVPLAGLILMISLAVCSCAPAQTPEATPVLVPTNTPAPTNTIFVPTTPAPEECSETGGDSITLPATDLSGTLDPTNCRDVWSFTMPAGTQLLISMNAATTDMHPQFSLMTTASETCTNCAEMTTLQTSENSPTWASMDFTLPYSGDYYLVAESASLVPAGSYLLSIDVGITAAEPTNTPVRPTKVPVQATKVPVQPTKMPSEPTQVPAEPTKASSSGGQGSSSSSGGVPVTITNNGSHYVKVVGKGPQTYTVNVEPKQTLMVYWVPGHYTFDVYRDGVYNGSISGDVNEEHGLLTIN